MSLLEKLFKPKPEPEPKTENVLPGSLPATQVKEKLSLSKVLRGRLPFTPILSRIFRKVLSFQPSFSTHRIQTV